MEQTPLISSGCFDLPTKEICQSCAPESWGTLWYLLFLAGISSQFGMAEFESWKLSEE